MPGAGGSATFLAFGTIVKRSLTTFTPTRHSPRPLLHLPPHNTLVSKASKGKKLPKNHFTSHRPLLNDNHQQPSQAQDQHGSKKQEKGPKRKAAQRTQAANTSLRRVAVEAQRSRGGTANPSGFIKGRGQRRHVDPEVETKDVTAYCAAETYNIYVARDLLQKEGWEADPHNTALFPQVLHVQFRSATWGRGKEDGEGLGDVLVFPSGSVVTWNVPEKAALNLVEKVLLPAAGASHLDRIEAEDLEYLEDPTRETSEILGDTIILGTKPPGNASENPDDTSSHHPETDTILAKIAFSSALARSTKLAVLENSLTAYFDTTSTIPALLSNNRLPWIMRRFMLRKTGELLHIRAQLNLYSELTDSLPDLFWDSPHELGLESYYDAVGKSLDVGQRIRALNEKMDYANEIAMVLRERLSEAHSHLLEWIIIWLIVIEVAYGSWHLWREHVEKVDPDSTTNLMRAYLRKELGGEKGRDEAR
ncbi:uncharacterized protein LTR77_003278 [Saxophila tyrrhenica]|uniref:DUF155 domain-containing protein n=1 Tax=Saxophila tyrrhenica TaxID=1690608 RepID=A0AAV9PHE8_9PEZI|nr:hypothetical protein LTR77_003278 [Saxophila tyrrhenica]